MNAPERWKSIVWLGFKTFHRFIRFRTERDINSVTRYILLSCQLSLVCPIFQSSYSTIILPYGSKEIMLFENYFHLEKRIYLFSTVVTILGRFKKLIYCLQLELWFNAETQWHHRSSIDNQWIGCHLPIQQIDISQYSYQKNRDMKLPLLCMANERYSFKNIVQNTLHL